MVKILFIFRKFIYLIGGHRDKRVGERARSIFIQFDSEGVLSIRKPRVSSKEGFREGIIDFSSTEQTP